MSHPGKSESGSRNAGFTLFELLVVMALLAMAAGAVTVLARPGSGSADLKAFAMESASRLRDARAAAVNRNQERVVWLDVQARHIDFGDGKPLAVFPAQTDLTLTTAQIETGSNGAAGIRFFPNGRSTGGTVRLARKGLIYEIRVNWLTGRVSLETVS